MTGVREIFQGPSLQSEQCGDGTASWGCLLSPSSSLPVDHPGVVAEVGPGCRCGCVVHLGAAKPRRILATSTASCPGRTFWLIQVSLLIQIPTLEHKYSHKILTRHSDHIYIYAVQMSSPWKFLCIVWHGELLVKPRELRMDEYTSSEENMNSVNILTFDAEFFFKFFNSLLAIRIT
jgi:hypothetical protein